MDGDQQEHFVEMRDLYLKRLRKLEQQAARLGSNTPPEILTEIETIRRDIAHIDVQLDANYQNADTEFPFAQGGSTYHEKRHDDSRLSKIGWEARDSRLLRSYFERCAKFDELFKDHPDLDELKVREYLIASGLADRGQDGRIFLTHAGILLCCRRDQIPRHIFHVHVKFQQKYSGDDLNEELFGSTLFLYDELYQRLNPLFRRRMGSPDIRDDAGIEGVFYEYPEQAIVEALANFLIHRDYSLDDIGFIVVHSDRVEFINPGQSLYQPEELLTTTSPLRPRYQRNPRLIEAINKARLNQREGGGILRMREFLERNRSYRPDGSLGLSIENDPSKNRFILTIYKRTSRNQTVLLSPHPGSVPPLPTLIIGREDALRDLKARLGIAPGSRSSSPVQILTAVRGWPGVGKTTLAAALAHDPDVAATFPDGVLWASLGPNPNLLSELAAWGRALGNDDLLRSSSIEEASAQLAALLRDKRLLLIVDDVWEPRHSIPFKVGGRECSILITTRINSVASALAPTPDNIYKLPVLTDEKALKLLQVLAPTVVAQYPQESLELVRELEGLPLALQVAGRLLNTEASYGFGARDLLAELRAGSRLLEALAPTDRADVAHETVPTIAVLLQKSTDRLDAVTRNCFAYLGAFAPKPATFDLAALGAVWQVDDPKYVVRVLVDRGLLEPFSGGRFQMHALLVTHARSLLTE